MSKSCFENPSRVIFSHFSTAQVSSVACLLYTSNQKLQRIHPAHEQDHASALIFNHIHKWLVHNKVICFLTWQMCRRDSVKAVIAAQLVPLFKRLLPEKDDKEANEQAKEA